VFAPEAFSMLLITIREPKALEADAPGARAARPQ
jgi:hypothetical protein